MENCAVRHPKLNIKFIGLTVSAEGVWGIAAALVAFFTALAFLKF